MAIELKVSNNLTRKKEVFRPRVPGEVKFYSCGPTTYDFLHVGNARALVVGDLFNRVLRSFGYKVTFVRNYTDVDDKIIIRAGELNKDPVEHAELYIKECEQDMASLGMMAPDFTPKVTESMGEIISLIEVLVKKGAAYVVEGEVLYHVPSFKEYGKLSKMDFEGLQHGKRVQVEDHKKHAADFVLWKPAKPGEPYWESPWGNGRPGWHIECSAMALKFLGETIDLHHGGVDLIFPHHENEIAQSEAASGKLFCAHWCHNEFLNFGTEKMSKSLGNVITIRKFVEAYGGQVLRQIFLSCHYRAKLDWSDEVVEKAIHDVERIHQFVLELEKASELGKKMDSSVSAPAEEIAEIKGLKDKMIEELANDFNTPGALSHFFTLIRKMRRQYLVEGSSAAPAIFEAAGVVVDFVRKTLGCIHKNPREVLEKISIIKRAALGDLPQIDPAYVDNLIEERKAAKENKNWARADEIRRQLKEEHVVLQDHPDGSTTWKIE